MKRTPKSRKQPDLLQEAPVQRFEANAQLGEPFSNDHVMAEGFRRAGDILVTHSLRNRGSINFLVYPALFNYRHFVELTLKTLIVEAERCHDLALQAGAPLGTLPERVATKLNRCHSIKELVGYLRERVSLVLREPLDPQAEKLLGELDALDPTSQAFRYSADKKGRQLQSNIIDLVNVKRQMKRVAEILKGLECYLACDREQSEAVLDNVL